MNNAKEIIKANKYYIVDTGIFVVVIIAFIISFALLNKNIASFLNTQNQIASVQLTGQANDQALQDFAKSNISSSDFGNSLPTQTTIIQWVEQTEEIAKLTGVSQTIAFSSGELSKDNIIIPSSGSNSQNPTLGVTMVLRGKYNTILSYIDMLDHSYYYTTINTISFSVIAPSSGTTGGSTSVTPTPAANPNQTVSASLTLTLYIGSVSTN